MTTPDPTCKVCGEFAEYDTPSDLCHEHWEAWFTEGYSEEELAEHYLGRIEAHQEKIDYFRKKLIG